MKFSAAIPSIGISCISKQGACEGISESIEPVVPEMWVEFWLRGRRERSTDPKVGPPELCASCLRLGLSHNQTRHLRDQNGLLGSRTEPISGKSIMAKTVRLELSYAIEHSQEVQDKFSFLMTEPVRRTSGIDPKFSENHQ